MRSLVVARTVPWPPISGARIRLGRMVRALARLGAVDLFVIADKNGETPAPPDAGVTRFRTVPQPPARGGIRALAQALPARDWRGVRAVLAGWKSARYDLTWCHHVESFLAVEPLVEPPIIVDFDDLEDVKLLQRLAVPPRPGRVTALAAARRHITAGIGTRHAAHWTHVQRSVASRVAAVVVCSFDDRDTLAMPNAIVVPNGYDETTVAVGRPDAHERPVIAFPGFLAYPPNRDAAIYLVQEIGPLIRTRRPGTQIRLIGAAPDAVRALHRPPDVVVTGVIPRMAEELAAADVIAVPIRYGGGTRIKILEAFAHRIPVVSTSVGVRGIDAVPGQELLVGDTPQDFADACALALTDMALRRAMTAAAHALFERRYRWDKIEVCVAAIAANVVAKNGAGDAIARACTSRHA